jgi:hypothetical protein
MVPPAPLVPLALLSIDVPVVLEGCDCMELPPVVLPEVPLPLVP